LCSDLAHIHVDECGAPERWTGSKIVAVPSRNGKLDPTSVEPYFSRVGDQHASQPRVISISQSTEYGTLYTAAEIKALADLAHRHRAYLHMDGARLSNAAAGLNLKLAEFTVDAGVDLLSFGGTKNGLMGAEAVVFFQPELAQEFAFIRKQGLHLSSKMRYLAAQFLAYFEDDLYLKNAIHANGMARRLSDGLASIPSIKITQPVQANVVFASLAPSLIEALQKDFYFYVWNASLSEVRLMCSFDTTAEQVDQFIRRAGELK
jgi:threonine aldolase